MTTLVGVPVHDVERAWPLVDRWIDKACRRADDVFGPEDIKELLVSGAMQLWLAITGENDVIGVCVTELRTFPRKRVCFVILGTGQSRDLWMHHVDGIMAWAKAQGCHKFKMVARWGWAKEFKGKLNATHVLLEKELA